MRISFIALLFLASCSSDALPVRVELTESNPALEWALSDLIEDLEKSGVTDVARGDASSCVDGEIHIEIFGVDRGLPAQAISIRDEACGQGHRIRVAGGDLLSAQGAVYELLRRTGVRYFHPEATYHPQRPTWPADASMDAQPAFFSRVYGAHTTHPIELSAPLDADPEETRGIQKRWVDWNVKLRQTHLGGIDEAVIGEYAYARGFPRLTGFNLLNSQQGGRPILDPDDPRDEEAQIAEAIESKMAPDEFPRPSVFSMQFNPSEFTEADDRDTVRRLTFFSNYLSEHHPDVAQMTTNHGTAGSTTAHYGVRFFDLPQFTPEALGVDLHTLMFYDLDRPAPVYGNTSFEYLYDFAAREGPKRRIHYFPEGSWWLTFDLPVPLYLAPVTLEARNRDIQRLRTMLSEDESSTSGVYGHRLFTSGQEWGYWLIDWCVGHMAWDASLTDEKCVEQFTQIFERGEEVQAIFFEAARDQAEHMRDPEVIRFMVGSDRETELAFDAGIVFHPLPPGPRAVLSFSDQEVDALERRSLVPLRGIAQRFHAHADTLEEILSEQSEAARPWLAEMVDGFRVYALRAEHSLSVYEAALALRSAIATGRLDAINDAAQGVGRAEALTDRARDVVRRREAGYRYPDALTIAGDEPGAPGAIPNRTIYPYRYLSRTHRMFYWQRPNEQLSELFGGGLDVVQVDRRVLSRDEALTISLLEAPTNGVRLEFSDGEVLDTLSPKRFLADGRYEWSLDATLSTGVVHHEDEVVVVERRMQFDLAVVEPAGADVLDGLLPGLAVGIGDADGSAFMAIGRIDEGDTAARGSLSTRARSGLVSETTDWPLTLPDVGDVLVRGAEFEVADGAEPRLLVRGRLATAEIITLLVGVGGFEDVGAKKIVSEALGYSPETLPDEVRFQILGTSE